MWRVMWTTLLLVSVVPLQYLVLKKATPEMVAMLERGLNQLANVIKSTTGIDYRHLAGGGAAGGISVAAAAFLGAQLKPGIDIVIQAVDLEKEMMDADLVIVGEGSMDEQTAGGKHRLVLPKWRQNTMFQ